jgi:rod shape-determining protein MreB
MTFTARGKDLITGVPKAAVVNDDEIREALREPVKAIVDVINRALEQTSAELAGDIYDIGVMITGGGSLVRGLDRHIAEKTGLKVYRAKDPLRSVVMGSGKVLDQFKLLKKICVT